MNNPEWSQRIWKDFTTREFIPLKILYFLVSAAASSMMPFLTLHARALGIMEIELGIVFAINALFTVLVPAPSGILADKIGNFKVFLSLTMAASGGAALLFSAVPVARSYHTLPDNLPLTLTNMNNDTLGILVPASLQCEFLPKLDNFTVSLSNCSLCDPSSVTHGGCIPSGSSVCMQQEVDVPDEMNVEVRITTSNSSLSNGTFLEIIRLNGTNFPPKPKDSDAKWCPTECSASLPRLNLCTNTHSVQTFDPTKTFWLYLLVRILNGITLASSYSLYDGATMAITKQYGGEYGLQRLYSNLGSIVMTPISGILLDYFTDHTGLQDFRPCFYLYCGLKIMAAMVILFLNLDFRLPSDRVVKDFRKLLKKPEISAFLVVMLISGTCIAVLDIFLFWLLQDLGAKKYLMGITITVGYSAGIPVLIASSYIFKKLGFPNTIVLGFAFYVVRLMGYSFITNPWWCMPFEALECFTVSLMSAAAVSYAADLATPSTLATLQGMYGGIYYGVGRGLGSLVSGFLVGPLGLRNMFRVLALTCCITGALYFITNYMFFRKLQTRRQVRKEMMECNYSCDGAVQGQRTDSNSSHLLEDVMEQNYNKDSTL